MGESDLKQSTATLGLLAAVSHHVNGTHHPGRVPPLADILNAPNFRAVWALLSPGERVAAVELAWEAVPHNALAREGTIGAKASMDLAKSHRASASKVFTALHGDHAGQYAALIWLGRWLGLNGDNHVLKVADRTVRVSQPDVAADDTVSGVWSYRTESDCSCTLVTASQCSPPAQATGTPGDSRLVKAEPM